MGRPFLEMALGISIGKLDVSTEKSLVYHPEYKGVRQLQAAVRRVKASREWEAKFMIFEEMLQEQREAGKAEGRAAGKAEAILILLEGLSDEVPKDLREYLFSEKDSNVLHRYLKLAASASSVEEFAQLIRQ